MKLDVKFAGNARTFSTGFSGTTFIHAGQNGATFIPAVSEDGIISWSNDRNLPNPEPVRIKGSDGYTPVAGEDYFTAADKAEMVAAVIASLPVYGGETA